MLIIFLKLKFRTHVIYRCIKIINVSICDCLIIFQYYTFEKLAKPKNYRKREPDLQPYYNEQIPKSHVKFFNLALTFYTPKTSPTIIVLLKKKRVSLECKNRVQSEFF